jgi:maleylacetoacetate isomerase
LPIAYLESQQETLFHSLFLACVLTLGEHPRMAPTDPTLTLYHYWRSSSSWRVRTVLFYKELEFTSVFVNLLEGEQKSESHRTRNPIGFVPVLEVGNQQLGESVAICEFLEDMYPSPSLRPESPWQRAKMRQLVEIINAGTQPIQNLGVMKRVSPEREQQVAWSKYFIEKGLTAFQDMLSQWEQNGEKTGQFCLGEAPSLADVFLVPQLYNARRFDVDMSAFPKLVAIEKHCLETTAFQKASPDAWKPESLESRYH